MIAPGSTMGIIGGGQLGRMTAQSAKSLGYRVAILERTRDCPAGSLADHLVVGAYGDAGALRELANLCDVVTYEFENISVAGLEQIATEVPVRPHPKLLAASQNRLLEKGFLENHGMPLPAYLAVEEPGELEPTLEKLGGSGILKSARFGYDGKGQLRVEAPLNQATMAEAASLLARGPCVLEELIQYAGEYSVAVARSPQGEVVAYPAFENRHRNHILDQTIFPARLDGGKVAEVDQLAMRFAQSIGLEGLLVIEFFLTQDGRWLVNEMAPRPHNSAHVTMNAGVTSQFEQLVRSICDLPLGVVKPRRPGAMINLLGEVWKTEVPDWKGLLAVEETYLHLYGKAEAREQRKMGHCNVYADTGEELDQRIHEMRRVLGLPQPRLEGGWTR